MDAVVLGLSGGVDSAVAGSILKAQGFAVTGVFLDIGQPGALAAARSTAGELGIAFEALDISKRIEEKVCAYFVREYLSGRTPNPCVVCNPSVKFPALLEFADKLGANYIATGHYARIERFSGAAHLLRAGENDQSYMLHRLTQDILSRLLLPLGSFASKEAVRALAAERALACAEKPDSMEICFIPDNDYAAYIQSRGAVPPPGDFVDGQGNVLGRHLGIHHYTVGQRRGLGISASARLFVSAIEPEKNHVVLSFEKEPVSELCAENVSWTVLNPETPFDAFVKLRHSKKEYPARVFPQGRSARIVFDSPVYPSAPGQAAVFYRENEVLGGGFVL